MLPHPRDRIHGICHTQRGRVGSSGVLRTATRVSGSYERANLLETIAGRSKVTGSARELYVSATKGMGSHDENRVLAALVRAEVRR